MLIVLTDKYWWHASRDACGLHPTNRLGEGLAQQGWGEFRVSSVFFHSLVCVHPARVVRPVMVCLDIDANEASGQWHIIGPPAVRLQEGHLYNHDVYTAPALALSTDVKLGKTRGRIEVDRLHACDKFRKYRWILTQTCD